MATYSSNDHTDLFKELQALRAQNQTMASDLSSLHTKLASLKVRILTFLSTMFDHAPPSD
jgi:hypothetical protein